MKLFQYFRMAMVTIGKQRVDYLVGGWPIGHQSRGVI
jgi:hypothetical protein